MNLKKTILILIYTLVLNSCADYNTSKTKKKQDKLYYSSKGFALIYTNSAFEKKIVDKKLINNNEYALHSILDNDTLVNISNPLNLKSLMVKIKKSSKYPSIYNIVITKKMAETLDLDFDNPYVEVLTIKQNDKFIAKKALIFEEEKNVANKAPVTSVNINDLSVYSAEIMTKNKKPLYIIDIADFYFSETAKSVKNRFENEANLKNIKIEKISEKKFKVYSGPYNTFNSMKDTYLILNELGFEGLNIINRNK